MGAGGRGRAFEALPSELQRPVVERLDGAAARALRGASRGMRELVTRVHAARVHDPPDSYEFVDERGNQAGVEDVATLLATETLRCLREGWVAYKAGLPRTVTWRRAFDVTRFPKSLGTRAFFGGTCAAEPAATGWRGWRHCTFQVHAGIDDRVIVNVQFSNFLAATYGAVVRVRHPKRLARAPRYPRAVATAVIHAGVRLARAVLRHPPDAVELRRSSDEMDASVLPIVRRYFDDVVVHTL